MNYKFLNGNNIANDAKVIKNDFEQHMDIVYIFTKANTPLYSYIGSLEDNGVNNAIMFKLKICREIKGIDLSFLRAGKEEQKLTSLSSLISLLDGTPCSVIVNDNDRGILADVSQQLIYIGYPLTAVNIMLRNEAKDAEKTQRFMKQINNISTAIDKAVTGIDKISAEWDGSDKLPADKMKECIDLIGEARQRCQAIQEKVRKAQSVEMTIAVAASKKTGKSVIVNSMIGEEIAPTSLLLPTPNTCIYKKSPDAKYHIFLNGEPNEDNVIQKIQSDFTSRKDVYEILNKEFDDSVRGNKPVVDMTIQYPTAGNNFESYTIFDTPGPDFAADDNHARAAREAMRVCDVAIFAIDFTKYLTDTEKEYLEKVKADFNENQKYASLIFAINKLDQKYTDANGSKSTTYVIDFIKHQLMNLGDMYKDCIVFATSAIQYYNTVHCEKEIGSDFSQLDDLYDLRKVMNGQPDNIRFELQFLQNMASTYSNQMGLDRVSPADMKQYSGIPDLLSYAAYICKSKARHEIVNNITVTIDLNNKALRAISRNIESIEKLINAEESQIDRTRAVIDDYTNSVRKMLTNEVFLEELRAENASAGANENEFRSLNYYFKKINKESLSFADIKDYTRNKIEGKFKNNYQVYKEIYGYIEKFTFDCLVSKLEKSRKKGNILNDTQLDSILNECIPDNILSAICKYIVDKVNETQEENQDFITQLNCDINELLNQRLKKIEKSSDKCRSDLKKFDVPLDLPEIPDFDFEMPALPILPKLNPEDVNFHIKTDSFKNLIKRENNPFVYFFRALFSGNLRKTIYYNEEKPDFNRFKEELGKQREHILDELDTGAVINELLSENTKCADELENIIDSISVQMSNILELLKSSISKFSNLIDDTRKHKENIGYHNAKKMLINDLMNATADFSDCWNIVLDKIDSSKEMV